MSKGKFGLGLLFGAAVGAVAGILTAPKSGKETRKELKEKAEEIGKVVKEKTSEAAENTEKVIDEVKEKTSEFVEDAKVKTEAAVEEVKIEAGKLQKRVRNTYEGAEKGFGKKV